MPIWLPAWKTLVNSASSFSRKQAKGWLLAVLPRKVTSVHPWPWLSATLPCTPGTQPLHSAVAVKGSRSPFGWLWDEHSRDPKANQATGTRSSPHEARSVQLVYLSSCKRTILFCIIPNFKASFYLFIYLLHFTTPPQFKFSSDFCLFSKTFLIGNNFHFQARSRLEIQNYLKESIMHIK